MVIVGSIMGLLTVLFHLRSMTPMFCSTNKEKPFVGSDWSKDGPTRFDEEFSSLLVG
jgi:hypothetical protein